MVRRPTGLAVVALFGAAFAACTEEARPAATEAVCLPGGRFEMGTYASDPCGRVTADAVICRVEEIAERPWHEVFLTPYLLDRTEVTNGQYEDCVERGPCTPPARSEAGSVALGTYTRFYTQGERWAAYPVVGVDYEQAKTYCAWRGGRLPTEAEWEMAARGPGGAATDAWSWGEEPEPVAACRADAEAIAFGRCTQGMPWPVGRAALDRRAGVRDLMGNVAEWVLDAWDPLAFCSDESRALYLPAAEASVAALPVLTDPRALDARCAGLPDCLAACDAERLWCEGACFECRDRAPADFEACQADAYCLQACQVPVDCTCTEPREGRSEACAQACLCLPTCRGATFPPAATPETCLNHCFDVAEDRCRERGCLNADCRTFCGDLVRESNRLCDVRRQPGDRPVEVPLVTTSPRGLEGNFVVKGGDYLISEDDACDLRVGRRRPQAGGSPRVGFRCAFDVPPGQRDCAAAEDG
ncbi:formylglycine-generating enzyme family protein [Myxococcota bacterium]|nr:formylglycine-generating enzyme family protein [Myxococcota bacterium]